MRYGRTRGCDSHRLREHNLARILRAGAVAAVAAFAQAVFTAQAAASGVATPRCIFLLGAAATLIGSIAINMTTDQARSQSDGDVPETARAALSGVHHHTWIEMTVSSCQHSQLELLSPWEIIRKYSCQACDAILTCACDTQMATRVLPHQAMQGTEDYSGAKIPVTHPLTPNICDECRGIPPQVHPRAAIRGAMTKLRRYYWREIWTGTHLMFLEWCDDQGIVTQDGAGNCLILGLEGQYKDQYEQFEREVIDQVAQLHKTAPKYVYDEPSDAEIIKQHNVRVIDFKATYLNPTQGQVLVLPLGDTDPEKAKPVEDFVAAQLRSEGREVMFCESLPFQALFGSLMWMWVQAPADPFLRPSGIGTRPGEGGSDEMIWTMLPADFGRQAHGDRRRVELERHLDFIGATAKDLRWAFDYWLEPSRPLRQYLWAYKPEDEQRARELIRVLGVQKVKTVLQWMAESYWDRYLGWPDLFTWCETPNEPSDLLLVEVKSSGDHLSGDQRKWIQGNRDRLGFEFALAKVHRTQKLVVG